MRLAAAGLVPRQHPPADRAPGVPLDELPNRATTADLQVVRMGADADHLQRLGRNSAINREEAHSCSKPPRPQEPIALPWLRGCGERLPDFPRRRATRVQIVQVLLVLERVHRGPEPVVAVRDQPPLLDQPTEGLVHQLLPLPEILEDVALEDEVASVDPNRTLVHVLNPGHYVPVAQRDDVKTQARPDAHETRDRVVTTKVVDLTMQREVGETIAVVG